MEIYLPQIGCHTLAKPTGSVCNLDCEYCFYLEKEKLYPDRQENWRMSEETLELYIKQQIEAQPGQNVEIAFQGGEPTMMGLNFFVKAMQLQKKYGQGRLITNTMQTNGIKLDEDWCVFLKENNFLVGLSIDGPEDIHDAYRVNRAGKSSHKKVMQAVELLKRHNVEFNTLTVVNDKVAAEPIRVYQFLKSIGSRFMQFIPLVERKAIDATPEGLYLVSPDYQSVAQVTPWSVSAEEFGNFLIDIWKHWVKRDVGQVYIQLFDATLGSWYGEPPGVCIFSKYCGHSLALESNGDLYNCDHFVYPENLLGNIHGKSIKSMNHSAKANNFGADKYHKISSNCKSCEYQFLCNGDCPKHRFMPSNDGKKNLSYFCSSYKAFFKHTEKDMKTMVDLLKNEQPPAHIMQMKTPASNRTNVGRNSLCACGSGLKTKRCNH